MIKGTYQPSKTRRVRRHGYRSKALTKAGKIVLARRRLKGREKLVTV